MKNNYFWFQDIQVGHLRETKLSEKPPDEIGFLYSCGLFFYRMKESNLYLISASSKLHPPAAVKEM